MYLLRFVCTINLFVDLFVDYLSMVLSKEPQQKKRFNYTQEHLLLAYKAVVDDKQSTREASKRYGIPYMTLSDKVGARSPLFGKNKYVSYIHMHKLHFIDYIQYINIPTLHHHLQY